MAELHRHRQQEGLGMISPQTPNTAQLTDQLQNPPKIITGTVAGGLGSPIHEQGTMDHELGVGGEVNSLF